MAGLVSQLQAAALDPGVSVSDLLRRAAAVSSKLGARHIDDWITSERNGYAREAELPNYRMLRGELQVRNPYRGLQPLFGVPPDVLERLQTAPVIQRVSEIEHIATQPKGGTLSFPLPARTVEKLMNAMEIPLEPILVIQHASMIGILEGVRDAILDWALELESSGVVGDGLAFSTAEKAVAQQVTYNTVNHIGIMTNSQLQQHASHASQSIATDIDTKALADLVESIATAIRSTDLARHAELQAELGTLRAQAASPRPKRVVIAESLRSLRAILEGAAGSVLAEHAPQIAALIAAASSA